MNISGIISEYNPFHMGHKHHIDETRRMLGQDCGIVCVMSGNFVQRGEPAAFLKNARAEAAVKCGADLVLELPLPWALSSAEGFARGSLAMLGATGIVTHLSFGSECGDVLPLDNCARLLLRPEMDAAIREKLGQGMSYARARQAAADELAGGHVSALGSPNNILGIEYIKAIYELRLDISPVTVRREGAGHDQPGECAMPSASHLRSMLADGKDISRFIPAPAAEVFARESAAGRGPVMAQALDTAIVSRLRMLPQSAFEALPDASEGLDARLYRACRTECDLDGIISAAATKRYALSRLRRMIMCAALGIERGMSEEAPPYIRVLAVGERGRGLLKMMQEKCTVPIVTKPGEINRLGYDARRCFALESAATDLFVLGFSAREERRGDRDWRSSPYILKRDEMKK